MTNRCSWKSTDRDCNPETRRLRRQAMYGSEYNVGSCTCLTKQVCLLSVSKVVYDR
jgi:hypothetical protein